MMMLSRYDIKKDGTVKLGYCGPSYYGSHDSYIFQTPIPNIDLLIAQTDFFVGGAMGCENLFAYRMCEAGVMVTNPCGTIKTYHNHNSDHWDSMNANDPSIHDNRLNKPPTNYWAKPSRALPAQRSGHCLEIFTYGPNGDRNS